MFSSIKIVNKTSSFIKFWRRINKLIYLEHIYLKCSNDIIIISCKHQLYYPHHHHHFLLFPQKHMPKEKMPNNEGHNPSLCFLKSFTGNHVNYHSQSWTGGRSWIGQHIILFEADDFSHRTMCKYKHWNTIWG